MKNINKIRQILCKIQDRLTHANHSYIDHKSVELVEQGGVILWHDYGIWKGVTQALDEIEDENRFGLKNISGTSLVCWRKEFC